MNKSKFLKRSLAAILAILMVVAMVPSALAAQVVAESVPTARAAVDPGYNISVNGNKTEWDTAAEAYTAKVEFTEGAAVADFNVSMIEVSKTSVTVAGKDGIDLGSLGSGLNVLEPKNAVQSVDSFGAGTYTYTLTAVTTDDNGDDTTYTFKLVVTATMKVNSTDASIKAIKSAKLNKVISAKFDNEKNTIEIVKALGVTDTDAMKNADGTSFTNTKAGLSPIFVPTSDSISAMSYSAPNLTVTAQNGDTKVYKVSFTEEAAFDSFKLGDYEGKAKVTAGVTDPKVINVILPYSYIEYASSTPGDTDKVDVAKVNKLVNSWTVATGSEVKLASDVAESGDEMNFAIPGGTTDDSIDGVGYWVADTASGTKAVTVKTKKSGTTPVSVNIRVLVPKKNPEAKLTAIQVGPDDHNQIVNIPDGLTTVNVTMPYVAGVSSKDNLTATKIKVWGSTAANVELARDWTSNNCFNATSGTGATIGTPTAGVAESAKAINIKKTVYINVKSEDEKTTTLYTINVNPGQAGASNRELKSLEFIDPADDDKVVATGTISDGKVNITVPFATGIDPWDVLADLEVRAVASESAKIKVGNNVITDDPGDPQAAVYETTFTATPPTTTAKGYSDTTSDEPSKPTWTVDVDGLRVEVERIGTYSKDGIAADGSGTHTQISDTSDPNNGKFVWTFTPDSTKTLEDYKSAIQAALNAIDSTNWGFVIGTASEGSYPVTLTAKDTGAVDLDTVNATIKPVVSENGWENTTVGRGQVDPTSAVNTNTLVDYDEIVTLTDILDTDTDEGTVGDPGPKCIKIPTTGVTGDPAKGNQFKIVVYYDGGGANKETPYTVTINKKAPSTAATISSVKVTDDSDGTPDDNSVSYSANPSGSKQNGKIVVAPLPNKLNKDTIGTVTQMRFSELEVSENAKVFAIGIDGKSIIPMTITKDSDGKVTAFSDLFTNWQSATNNWTKSGKEVLIYVFSEKDWDKIDTNGHTGTPSDVTESQYDADRKQALVDDLTAVVDTSATATIAPTTLYKMSASYIAAENGSKLTNIASTLDENVKVAKGTNTYTITVPASYVKDTGAGKGFTLNFIPDSTSKLATVNANAVGTVVKSDEGDTKKQSAATMFVVVKDGNAYKLQTATGTIASPTASGTDITKFVVESESKTNTSPYDIVIKVAAAETSNTIESITADGTKAVLGADGETWTLTLPYGTTDMVKLIDIKTVSKLAAVKVDNVNYDKDLYYDLGADLAIEVAAESGPKATYTLKTVVSAEQPPVVDPSDSYKDIPAGGMGDWVKKAINAGIMGDTGTDANGKLIFAPQETTQRRWFALMVARADIMAADETITDKDAADKKLLADYGDKEPNFTDTANEADTAKAAIAYCQEKGIMNGDAGKFNPAGIVNRMEAASMLKNWLKLTEGGKENTHDFKDWDKIPDWAKGNINAVADDKIMNGHDDGTFGTENLTRVQTAVIMVQAYERLKESK